MVDFAILDGVCMQHHCGTVAHGSGLRDEIYLSVSVFSLLS